MSAPNFGLRARAMTGGEAAASTALSASSGGGFSRQGKSTILGSTSFLTTRKRANSELLAFKVRGLEVRMPLHCRLVYTLLHVLWISKHNSNLYILTPHTV